ncbi:MAG TPA: MBL fold metallo-hydrolase [Kiritimatiellia bacterium]|nr:MBL fold metallo-hydrolase [Kiritimatiellia bacterium]HOR97355.1 MBL fold metallo-hydrolase [Kiritimatiellia bacterium]HPC48847.1 MBL fold metallo-hydrolase [Kiritimatiellia bacterium]HPW74396.1 MBL fold metallo-hydrolase [Kiritimatiellia bacterium]
MEVTFLGTGTSVGVPMIGCRCAVCTSADPRNTRRRTSLYVRTPGAALVIDTPPDFRQQALDFGVDRVDAVVFTHAHADHIFGFDDIRRFNTLQQKVIPAYADTETLADVRRVFSYIGDRPSPLGLYRPLVEFIEVHGPFTVGDVQLTPLDVCHGNKMTGYLLEREGCRIGYVPDCHTMPDATVRRLRGVDVMILDALRYKPHPSHICVEESLRLLSEIDAGRSYLIHLCHDVDHAELEARLPEGVQVSFDGLRITVDETAAARPLPVRERSAG